jgi:hypothetical protein
VIAADKSFANGNGNSHANGSIVPPWLKMNWELRALVWPFRVTLYDFP